MLKEAIAHPQSYTKVAETHPLPKPYTPMRETISSRLQMQLIKLPSAITLLRGRVAGVTVERMLVRVKKTSELISSPTQSPTGGSYQELPEYRGGGKSRCPGCEDGQGYHRGRRCRKKATIGSSFSLPKFSVPKFSIKSNTIIFNNGKLN